MVDVSRYYEHYLCDRQTSHRHYKELDERENDGTNRLLEQFECSYFDVTSLNKMSLLLLSKQSKGDRGLLISDLWGPERGAGK